MRSILQHTLGFQTILILPSSYSLPSLLCHLACSYFNKIFYLTTKNLSFNILQQSTKEKRKVDPPLPPFKDRDANLIWVPDFPGLQWALKRKNKHETFCPKLLFFPDPKHILSSNFVLHSLLVVLIVLLKVCLVLQYPTASLGTPPS